MTIVDINTELFCRVDDALVDCQKHSQTNLYPSEVVTLGFLYALTGKGQQAFWRWLTKDYPELFPQRPDRSHRIRLFNSHRNLTPRFMADPSVMG